MWETSVSHNRNKLIYILRKMLLMSEFISSFIGQLILSRSNKMFLIVCLKIINVYARCPVTRGYTRETDESTSHGEQNKSFSRSKYFDIFFVNNLLFSVTILSP